MIRILAVSLCAMAPLVQAREPTVEPTITSVVMEQFECFWGTCPNYIVAINSDGSASYIGLSVAKKKGGVSLQLPPSAFDNVVNEIERINYFDLRESYVSEADGCKELWSDQSSVSFFVTRGGKTKKVHLYYGCKLPKVTDNLSGLASMIDAETGIAPLLGRGQ